MRLNSMRYQILFSLWRAMPSGRVLKKRSFALVSFIACGFCAVLHVSSSVGVRVLCVSEVRAASHNASLVHISSILLSAHSCSRVSSPPTEGNSHHFGSAWAIPFCRVCHVAWWAAVMSSFCPRQYPVICPTVWIGRFSSVIVVPAACRARLICRIGWMYFS